MPGKGRGWHGEPRRHAQAAMRVKSVSTGTFPGAKKQKHMKVKVWAVSRDDALLQTFNLYSPDKWYTDVASDVGRRKDEEGLEFWTFEAKRGDVKPSGKVLKLYEVALFERIRARERK